jgi:hypothetical protein
MRRGGRRLTTEGMTMERRALRATTGRHHQENNDDGDCLHLRPRPRLFFILFLLSVGVVLQHLNSTR